MRHRRRRGIPLLLADALIVKTLVVELQRIVILTRRIHQREVDLEPA